MLDSALAGKTCLITGGSTGIGLGISRALAREGVHLAVASRNPDADAIMYGIENVALVAVNRRNLSHKAAFSLFNVAF